MESVLIIGGLAAVFGFVMLLDFALMYLWVWRVADKYNAPAEGGQQEPEGDLWDNLTEDEKAYLRRFFK